MNRMDIRRRMLESAASGVSLSYTGDYDYFGDPVKGFAVLKTSGTLTIKGTVDLCLVGGGGKGHRGDYTSPNYRGGGGGAGGYVSNYIVQELDGDFFVTVGAGSSTQGSPGGQTSVGASYTANGGTSPSSTPNVNAAVTGRGTSGQGAIYRSDAKFPGFAGENGVYPWDDSTNFSSYRVSGCGGGGGYSSSTTYGPGAGGLGGGGNGGRASDGTLNGLGYPGADNTGGGGGGASSSNRTNGNGGNGGSGVVFVRWGY